MKAKSFDCKKEIESKSKFAPETEMLCRSISDLSEAYKKAQSQLSATSELKLKTMQSAGASQPDLASAKQAIALNSSLPTNLDPKDLTIPPKLVKNEEAPRGSWGNPLRYYDVQEYCVCNCGLEIAQVPGKSCPGDSKIVSCQSDGPYYLNNGGKDCDIHSNLPANKFTQDWYSPSTLTTGVKALHGPAVIDQAKALIASGDYKKLSGPEAMEFSYEIGQINCGSFRECESLSQLAAPFKEIIDPYLKSLPLLQEKTREAKKNSPQKVYGKLTYQFLDFEKDENRVPINTMAVVPITTPVTIEGGIASVRLVGGFWGQHGWEISNDGKNFVSIETPVDLKNGDIVYLRGQSVNSYNHQFGIEISFSAQKVNGKDYGEFVNVFLKTQDGCNADGLIQWDTEINLAPTIFPNGQNERCFTLPGVFGEVEKGKTDKGKNDIWKFGQGIVASLPMKPVGSEMSLDCSEIHRLAGKETPYKLSPYTNPYNSKKQDYYPVRDCKVSGKIKYICQPHRGWIPATDPGVCELK